MFQEKALVPAQLPLPDKNRKSTDIICTIVGAAFALTLFIAACVMLSKGNFINHFDHPLFNRQRQCGDSYIYVSDPKNLNTTSCVKQCPIEYFQAQGICLPQNEKQRDLYLQNPQISVPLQRKPFKWVLFYSFIIALSLGLLWLALVQCFPRIVPILAHILSAIFLITLGILIIILYDRFWNHTLWLKIIIPVICFTLAIISIVMLCIYANQVKFQGLLLEYSTKFLSKNPATFLYLPVFFIFMFALVCLIVFQHCNFSSGSSGLWSLANLGVWEVLNILQFIWGVQFLRDAFNFCVSGHATDYYWRENQKPSCATSYRRFICNHWGSVVGGSFLNAFFQIPTLISQLLICHPTTCCSKLGAICYNNCNFLTCFFNLVRTDSYSYINIAGIPFCNASRECKKICQNSKQFIGTHSSIKHYRYAAHVFLVSITFLGSWFILRARLWGYGIWHFAFIVVIIYITLTFFIGVHADSAQGLQTSYLCEHQLEPNHSLMQNLHPLFATDLEHWQRRQQTDGSC